MESIIYQVFNTYIFRVKLSASIKLKFSLPPTLIIIIIMGSYNARHIYPIGYSRRSCGATAALIRQPQAHPHNKEPEIRNRILWEGVRFLACRRKLSAQSARRKPTKAGMESTNQIHVQLLASCIGERPSVRAPNQPALPQG